MNDLEHIKDKVRKLLALSKSDNENEAAAALEKANSFIEKYDLNETALRFESVSIKSTKLYVHWRMAVANSVSWLYCCYNYQETSKGLMVFVGESFYVFMASEMYSYLIKSIERIAKKSIRKNAKYSYHKYFKFGMADRLNERIICLGQNCSWAPHRDINIEEAENFVKQSVELTTTKFKKVGFNYRAAARGRMCADGVSLARQTAHVPTPQLCMRPTTLVQGELF